MNTLRVVEPVSEPLLPWLEDAELQHRRFEQIAELVPDTIAVQADGSITYRDLDGRANAIAANLLDARGDGVERIGILVESAIDHIASVIGVWKAGKTAVPLHEANPDGRLQHILDHSGCTALLGHGGDLERAANLAEAAGIPLVEVTGESGPLVSVDVDVDTLSRIMYTSGSTGLPKGVALSHRYEYDKERVSAEFYGWGVDDRICQMYPLAFAAATSLTFGALFNGGTSLQYSLDTQGLQHLAAYLDDERVTAMGLVPTLFRRFLQTVEPDRVFESVRVVSSGAEMVLRGDIDLFSQHFPSDSFFVHRLAATEVGEITSYVVRGSDPLDSAIVPAGYPGAEKVLLIIDDDGNELPDGEVGELVVCGPSLSQGYWENPDQNEAVFSDDPERPGWRRYYTRDLARRDANGIITHLGRKDGRIKVRGFGVDLVEVEHALLAGPGVKEGVVVATSTAGGDARLVGYSVVDDSYEEGDLRAHLVENVPEYAVPSSLVVLDELPLTVRGKVDRGVLRDRPLEGTEREITPPETELHEALAGLWMKVLELDEVGIDEEFFAVGGDSIQAYQLIAEIFQATGVDLPATVLLEAATIRAQADVIESGDSLAARALVGYRTEGDREPFFCVHGLGGGILFMKKLEPYLQEDRPVYAIQPEVTDDDKAEYQSVEQMASFYLSEIRSVQPQGPYYIGGSCFGSLVAWEMARTLSSVGEDVASLIMIDPPAPNYERPKLTLKQKIAKPVRRWLLRLTQRESLAQKRARWDRTARLRELHLEAGRQFEPQQSPVALEVIAANASTRRHKWMWGEVATSGLTIEEFPVGHGDMYDDANTEYIANMINERWAAIDGASVD